ncbi:MAG: RCC1 repeat-containing protein [Dokdonella sp.]|nr:MAG: RCC1 repeat-containing protein [Dokdonella sp.]
MAMPRIARWIAYALLAGSAGLVQAQLVPLADVVQVTTGGIHSCALTSTGGVKCWGNNDYGQLGDNSFTDRLTPVDVIGLSSGVQAISAGLSHTCALTSSGGVKCWGNGMSGQLGDSGLWPQATPVDVIGLTSGVLAISAGDIHTCALTSGGGVKCWGGNHNGQLGTNSTSGSLTPVDVIGLSSGAQAISAGGSHTCALVSGGGLKCWGDNGSGQVGDNSTTDRLVPVDVSGLASGVQAISAGDQHTCALVSGGAKCWGDNSFGQLGEGSNTSHLTPVDVTGLTSGMQAISAGGGHTCASTVGGGVKCWGSNASGQLGDNSTTGSLTPVDVSGLASGVQAISAGYEHTCALENGGELKCWGDNHYGQVGNNNPMYRLTPVDVTGLTNEVQAISTGDNYACALALGGVAKCWGLNANGQLGDNSTSIRPTPVDVTGLESGVQAIRESLYHTCGLTSGGGVKCWGDNDYGQLGDNSTTDSLTPVDVTGLASGIQTISVGGFHACALTIGGGVKCWGGNGSGQLGDNSTTGSLTPVDVTGLASSVQAISAGSSHTCALTSIGGVKCWGSNFIGQLGDNSTTDSLTPVDVIGLTSGVQAISAGGNVTCALTDFGGVRCWGSNGAGQLGDGSDTDRLVPVDVMGLTSDVQAISSGGSHTCALTSAGGVKCWGANDGGQLGDNSTTRRLTPVDVTGLASGALAISASGSHTCALSSSGGAKCWGYNSQGQVGDGSFYGEATPQTVLVIADLIFASGFD